MSTAASPFSAADPALGYVYQIRLALLFSLKRLKSNSSFLVSVEALDDVAFEDGTDAPALLQTKHHLKGTGSLSNSSKDLWKTLRVWIEGSASGVISDGASLVLVTTGIAPTGSAAARLKAEGHGRDVSLAQQALDAAASSSGNKENAAAYAAYLGIPPSARKQILQRVTVVDGSPNILDLDAELKEQIYWAVEKAHHGSFLERLEGWWLRRVLLQLTGVEEGIAGEEIESHIADLREQFKADALPIDDDLLQYVLDEATTSAHETSMFVKQLELAKAGPSRVYAAIRDYYRAFEQRSRWLRVDLVVGMDLDKYEKRLIEEWELVFAAMKDELGDEATEEAREKVARGVLKWAEQVSIPIRPSITVPFVCRGSLHMLSDKLRIGWHPEFLERLKLLLEENPA